MITVKIYSFIFCYLVILLFHFLYASWVIKQKRFSLEMGIIRKPFQILTLLLLLNGFSLSVFFYPVRAWIQANVLLHLLLSGDEGLRTWKVPGRFPFLINHLLFAVVLGLFLLVESN